MLLRRELTVPHNRGTICVPEIRIAIHCTLTGLIPSIMKWTDNLNNV